jgi:hypothetical protein
VGLEVVVRLLGGDEDCIQQLVDLQVPGLGLVEDLTDVVLRTLDGPNPMGGSNASISIRAGPGSSQSFASGETCEVRGPMIA